LTLVKTSVPERSSRRISPLAFQLASLAVLALASILLSGIAKDWMLDDAFISFRYVENFVAGHGLVYSIGERVEGYTNFLWIMLLSGFHRFHADTVAISRILGVLLNCLTLVLTWLASCRIFGRNRWETLVAPALLATCGAFTTWGLAGMEVPLFTFLVLAALAWFGDRPLGSLSHKPQTTSRLELGACSLSYFTAGLLTALATLTRPEGLIVMVVMVLAIATGLARKDRARTLLITIAGFAVLYLPYYVWRYAYYGYPLPNTFYAKVGATPAQVWRGARYFGTFIIGYPLTLLTAAAGAIVGRRNELIRSAGLAVGIFAGYIVLVGGDCMPAFRFFAPIAPLICLLAAEGVVRLSRKPGATNPRAGMTAVLTVVLIGASMFTTFSRHGLRRSVMDDTVVHYGRIVGMKLKAMARPDAVIATNTGGTVPYYSGLKAIDMLGMNDLHIAHRNVPMGAGRAGHEKSDGDYVFARSPDYIQFSTSWGSDRPWFRGDSELWRNPNFLERYVFRVYPLEGNRLFGFYELRKPR
jgi:arabinofuranosyltransferase